MSQVIVMEMKIAFNIGGKKSIGMTMNVVLRMSLFVKVWFLLIYIKLSLLFSQVKNDEY